jgi:toxin ParE1/3/4
MPLRIEITARARADFSSIVQFIAQRNGDLFIAAQFGRRILDRCSSITNAPGAGSPHPGHAGVRKLNEGSHKIFYRVEGGVVVILRIWDGRRGTEPRMTR